MEGLDITVMNLHGQWSVFVTIASGRRVAVELLSPPGFCQEERFTVFRKGQQIARGTIRPTTDESDDPAFMFDEEFGTFGKRWICLPAIQFDEGDRLLIEPNEEMASKDLVPSDFSVRYWAAMCRLDGSGFKDPLYLKKAL